MAKVLIAYYSLPGETIAPDHKVVILEKGHTKQAAEFIHEAVGGTLFEIKTVHRYSSNHFEMIKQAKDEYDTDRLPELKDTIDVSDYQIIFLGSPNWFGTMAMPVVSFLHKFDWAGKYIIPFGTSGGGEFFLGNVDLERYCPGAKIAKIKNFLGHEVDNLKDEIEAWAKEALDSCEKEIAESEAKKAE